MRPNKSLRNLRVYPFNSSILKISIVLVATILTPAVVKASDFHSPRTAALGGAGHAGPLLNDAVFLNPSFVSFLPVYSISWSFDKYSGTSADTRGRNYSLSILDGKSEMFQAGVAHTLREDGTFIHFGASKAVSKQLGVGIGGKFFMPTGSRTPENEAIVSMTFVPKEWLLAVAVIDNAMESPESRARGRYREFIFGTKFEASKQLYFYFDPHFKPTLTSGRYGYEAGVEVSAFKDFYLRGGMFRNSRVPSASEQGRGYGTGFGWVAPKISFDYAVQRVITPRSSTGHVFGTTIYF